MSQKYQKLYNAAEFLIRSNLYIALGAAFLTYGISYLSGIEPSVYFMAVSFLYFFSMYNINHIADKDSMRINEPDRIEFYEKNRDILLKIGVTSSLVSLFLSVIFGFASFLLMLISVCLGIAYSVKIFPSYFSKYIKYQRLKDILHQRMSLSPSHGQLYVSLCLHLPKYGEV